MSAPRQPATAAPIASTVERVVADATCLGCGCLCDDIDVVVREGQIVATEHACQLGAEWFAAPTSSSETCATIDGHAVALEVALERAAELLADAKSPLVTGLSGATCQTQRVAVAIADRLRACLDSQTSRAHGPALVAMQNVGEVTATLGEIANRSDLVIFWGTDPLESQPRHAERYSLNYEGMFVPRGRADRTCVVVDVRRSKTAEVADHFLQIMPGTDFEAMQILRALVRGIAVDPEAVRAATGISIDVWQDLAKRVRQARYGAVFHGIELSGGPSGQMNVEALLTLVSELNDVTRFVARGMRGDGNAAGTDEVLAWTTGYPFAVNLARGYPRYGPHEYTTARLFERGEVDAALVVMDDPLSALSSAASTHLRGIPVVAIDWRPSETMRAARVAFHVAKPSVHTAGTVYRADAVPLPLRPALPWSGPDATAILTMLESRLAAQQSNVRRKTEENAL